MDDCVVTSSRVAFDWFLNCDTDVLFRLNWVDLVYETELLSGWFVVIDLHLKWKLEIRVGLS